MIRISTALIAALSLGETKFVNLSANWKPMNDARIDQADIESLLHQVANRWQRQLAWQEVEDLVGEALQVYCSKCSAGTRIERPLAWLLEVADRLGRKLICRLAKVHEHEKHEDAKLLADKEDRRHQNSTNHEDSVVDELLDRISVEQREVVVRCVMHDIPVADVARDLGLNYSTARSHMVRGIGRLRRDASSLAPQFRKLKQWS